MRLGKRCWEGLFFLQDKDLLETDMVFLLSAWKVEIRPGDGADIL